MCKVTLEYNQSNALARRKLAALLATGLFVKLGEEPDEVQMNIERDVTRRLGSIKQKYFDEIVDKIVESIF